MTADETSYDLIPSYEARKLLEDVRQTPVSVTSVNSEMPDPTASTSSKLPNNFEFSHQSVNWSARDVVEDSKIRSSDWFCSADSSQSKAAPEQTTPPAQGT